MSSRPLAMKRKEDNQLRDTKKNFDLGGILIYDLSISSRLFGTANTHFTAFSHLLQNQFKLLPVISAGDGESRVKSTN